MFIRKNLLEQSDMTRRNSLLKGLALFFLWASAVLLFSSANLTLNPGISNSFVYLQKMFFSPSWTSNTQATISLDWLSGAIVSQSLSSSTISSTTINTSVLTSSVATITTKAKIAQLCDVADTNCFIPSSITTLSSGLQNVTNHSTALQATVQALEAVVANLSGRVAALE